MLSNMYENIKYNFVYIQIYYWEKKTFYHQRFKYICRVMKVVFVLFEAWIITFLVAQISRSEINHYRYYSFFQFFEIKAENISAGKIHMVEQNEN